MLRNILSYINTLLVKFIYHLFISKFFLNSTRCWCCWWWWRNFIISTYWLRSVGIIIMNKLWYPKYPVIQIIIIIYNNRLALYLVSFIRYISNIQSFFLAFSLILFDFLFMITLFRHVQYHHPFISTIFDDKSIG